jgi:hypothetical protein
MTSSSESDKTGVLEVSGFDGLNLLDFIDADVPENIWPAKIRICGTSNNGHAVAKLFYINIDGTNSQTVSDYLDNNTELMLSEIECEIDVMRLLKTAGQLDVTLPNTARLTKNHKLSV